MWSFSESELVDSFSIARMVASSAAGIVADVAPVDVTFADAALIVASSS